MTVQRDPAVLWAGRRLRGKCDRIAAAINEHPTFPDVTSFQVEVVLYYALGSGVFEDQILPMWDPEEDEPWPPA